MDTIVGKGVNASIGVFIEGSDTGPNFNTVHIVCQGRVRIASGLWRLRRVTAGLGWSLPRAEVHEIQELTDDEIGVRVCMQYGGDMVTVCRPRPVIT